MFGFLNPYDYNTIHILIVSFLTLLAIVSIIGKSANELLYTRKNSIAIFLYAIIFVIVVGLRPVSSAFGDTTNYALIYYDSQGFPLQAKLEDPLFSFLLWWCAQRMDVQWFFFIVECLYIIPMVWACHRLMKRNADLALLFCFAAFSFFSYGVNGIRNGMACSIVVLAISFIQGKWYEKLFCLLLSVTAFYSHGSTALPVICMLVAYLIRKPKLMFYFWIASIIVSLVAGNYVSGLFTNLGFDERLSIYVNSEVDDDLFSRVGFRWDFLLYSAMPVLLGYYTVIRKHVFDRTFLLLLGTYIYANSFWLMVIRAEYSNRFAYLSWFLYPIVIAYPLFKLVIWPKTQGRKASIIMACHLAFTLFMHFIYKP